MKKIFFIIFVNSILLIVLFFVIEFLIYNHYKNLDSHAGKNINKFQYTVNAKFSSYMENLEHFFNGNGNYFYGRLPDGLRYSNKSAIIIFGCSYAYGFELDANKTFSYKLSQKLKRPVYNRSIPGGSFQHMYMQSISDSLYNRIPNADTVIYVMMSDHYRRLLTQYVRMTDLVVYPTYNIKNNELVSRNYNNKVKNFFESLYIVKYLNHIYAQRYINNPKNEKKLTDMSLLYFNKSKGELQKHYGKNIKFYIFLYEDSDILYSDILRKKLEDNGFLVVSTRDLTKEDLTKPEYKWDDNCHPSEKAWDLLTPLIIKKLKLK